MPMSGAETSHTPIANASGGICRPNTGLGMIAVTSPNAIPDTTVQKAAWSRRRRSRRARSGLEAGNVSSLGQEGLTPSR